MTRLHLNINLITAFWRAMLARRKFWILMSQTCRQVSFGLRYWRQIIFFTVPLSKIIFFSQNQSKEISLSKIIFFSQNQSKEIFFEKILSPPPPRISNGPCLIQIGTFIFHKKFLTTRVPLNFLEETRFSTSIYHLDTPLWRYNTRKYSLGELILLAKSKEYTLFYIPNKFQGV